MLVLLQLTLLIAGAASLTVHTQNHWAGGFQMQVDIPVTCELTSWKVHLLFSEDVNTVEVWTADVTKGTAQREFVISSKSYNGQQHVGDTLSFALMGHGSGDIAPSAELTIEGCDGGSGSGTTQSRATSAASSASTPSANTAGPTSQASTSQSPSAGGSSPTKDYGEALKKSILFYYAQRSGRLPADNPIPWRGDSALNDCVVGGWYDAGDHIKFGLPFGSTTHLLLWGLYLFKDGYQRADQLDEMYDTVKWALDYMLKAWNPITKELVAQIGDGRADHSYWGRPEDMTMDRPCHKVKVGDGGQDIAGEWAAALAAGYLVFKDKGDAAYATQLLTAAESLYAFSKTLIGSFTGSGPYYGSSGYKDEICEGAMWLYRATNNVQYLEDAKPNFQDMWAWALSWDDKKISCQLLLYESTREEVYRKTILGFMQGWYPDPELQVQYTPCGLAWRDTWGANRYAANSAFVALVAAELGIHPAEYRKWAVEQINYLLGDNNQYGGCFSFEIGYGTKYPLQPHHRGASCPDKPAACGWDNLSAPGPSPQTLYGALVGGPDWSGTYNDSRQDYVMNEVAIDYNSGFQSALAGIEHLIATNNLPATNNKCPCHSGK